MSPALETIFISPEKAAELSGVSVRTRLSPIGAQTLQGAP